MDECGSFENCCGEDSTGGSNPSPTAKEGSKEVVDTLEKVTEALISRHHKIFEAFQSEPWKDRTEAEIYAEVWEYAAEAEKLLSGILDGSTANSHEALQEARAFTALVSNCLQVLIPPVTKEELELVGELLFFFESPRSSTD
jgi:hypothetical protein